VRRWYVAEVLLQIGRLARLVLDCCFLCCLACLWVQGILQNSCLWALHCNWGLLQLSRCFLAVWGGRGICVKQEESVQCNVRFSLLSIPPSLTLKFDYKKTLFLYCLMKASWFQIPQIHSRPVWWVHASKTHKFKAFCATTTVHNNSLILATHNLWWSMTERKLKSTDEGICTKVAVIGFTWLPFPSVAWPPLAWFLQYVSKILSEASFPLLHINITKPILLL